MSIAPVEAQFKTSLAAATAWPVRWINERWGTGVLLSDGDMPLDSAGIPISCIEAEIIGGNITATIAARGSRVTTRRGVFHAYLSVRQGSGLSTIGAEADAIANYFQRRTLITGFPILRSMDVRIDGGVASYEEGNRFVRKVSVLWEYEYFA